MQIGRDRVGYPPLPDGRHDLAKEKAPAAVAHVEDHAALASLEQIRQHILLRVQHGHPIQIHVCRNIAGAHFAQHQLLVRALRPEGAEVHHHRDIGQSSGLDSSIHGYPFRPRVVGCLDAHNQAWIFFGHGCRGLGVHLRNVLLIRGSAHARTHNIQECQYTRFRAVNDVRLEILEVFPS